MLTLGEVRKGVESLAGTARRLVAMAARPAPAIDSLLAATAMHHGLTLVTKNLRDMHGLGVPLINPWVD